MIRNSFLAGVAALLAAVSPLAADEPLVTVDKDFDVAKLRPRDAKATVAGKVLRVATGHDDPWPAIYFKPSKGTWDLSAFGYAAIDVKNVGDHSARAGLRVDSPRIDGKDQHVDAQATIEPGQRQTIIVALRKKMTDELRKKLFGMRGYPGGYDMWRGIDTAKITEMSLYVARPDKDHVFEVSNLRAGGKSVADPEKLFPMIDRYGQYIYRDWPGKVKSDADLAANKQREDADLKKHPGPKDWDRYGGWAAGPKLKATGRFYPAKYRGKWWLVDPEGRLFWSHGIDCVRTGNATTPITDRRHYFAALPKKESPPGRFYGHGSWAPHGYYVGKQYDTFNFTAANLLRKYGDDWKRQFTDRTHRRLRSWGMNTVANWSDPEIYLERRTPYTATIHARARQIGGSRGYWGKFPDPFDPSLKAGLRKRLAAERGKSVGDPWCIGYFVDNELSWGNDTSLALAALSSPADQPVKKVFADDLKKKYKTIARLNEAWGTKHASWEALLQGTKPPDANKAAADLGEFTTKIAEEYFRVCRDAVKAADPEALYLGCRFAWVNDRAAKAGAGFCDVVSYNRYKRSVADLRLPGGIDKPLVVGEFHFGALDRGMLHTGLVPCRDQQHRARSYKEYVEGALDNPYLVGTHWFQYGDQATTGRGDGENYQIGFLDVCDTPYPETIEACREVGYSMYKRRTGKNQGEPE